ncbi:MAG: hypothetical protein AAF915_24195 [Cyanobacteria bacterium P01_D01_bin.50]
MGLTNCDRVFFDSGMAAIVTTLGYFCCIYGVLVGINKLRSRLF